MATNKVYNIVGSLHAGVVSAPAAQDAEWFSHGLEHKLAVGSARKGMLESYLSAPALETDL